MSQNRNNLQTTQRVPQQGLQTRQVSGKLTRLSDHTEAKELSTINPEEAALWLEEAHKQGHVVSPATSMPIFPHGRGVQVSIVRITDFNPQGTQLYPIPGSPNLGLHKNVLDDIGRGYGIDWPPEWSVDVPFSRPGQPPDPRDADPWVVQWRVCGRIRKFDGGWMTLPAMTKEVDLREGSAEIEQIRTRQADKALQYGTGTKEQRLEEGHKKANAEIAQIRKFIKSHAQTKARLMVIGTLVRRSYSKEELSLPFFVFQGIWVGRSDNPKIDEMFARGAIEMEQAARGILYGGSPEAPPQLPPVSEEPYQEDAELVAYNEALTAESVELETIPAESVETATQQPQCSPEVCYGKGAAHVKACYETAASSSPSQPTASAPTAEAWVITDGAMKGVAINEPQVTLAHLSSLLDFYVTKLESNDDLSEADVERLKTRRRHVETELTRRGVIN